MRIITDKPIALDSLDHIQPNGTKNDNSTNPFFNKRLYELIPAQHVRLLDIGCAGGGLVKSILDDGGFAVGIDGSDYSRVNQRAEWATIPDYLFTADVTEPFELAYDDKWVGALSFSKALFNVVTGWEFFEHIEESKIEAVCMNICSHMMLDSFFIGSINRNAELHHRTVKPREWWIEKFTQCGLAYADDIVKHFGNSLVRREGFPIGLRHA